MERRKSQSQGDIWYRIMLVANAVLWLVFFLLVGLFHYARPEFVSSLERYWGPVEAKGWDPVLSQYLFQAFAVLLGLTLAVWVMYRRRARRRSDPLGLNLYVLAAISLAAVLVLRSYF